MPSISELRNIINAVDSIPEVVLRDFPHIMDGFDKMVNPEEISDDTTSDVSRDCSRLTIAKDDILAYIAKFRPTLEELRDGLGSKVSEGRIKRWMRCGEVHRSKDFSKVGTPFMYFIGE